MYYKPGSHVQSIVQVCVNIKTLTVNAGTRKRKLIFAFVLHVKIANMSL